MVVRNQHGTWVLLTVLDNGLHSSCATLCALARSPAAAAVMRLVDTWAQTQRPALAQLWTERRANLLRLDWLSRVLAQNAKSATAE